MLSLPLVLEGDAEKLFEMKGLETSAGRLTILESRSIVGAAFE